MGFRVRAYAPGFCLFAASLALAPAHAQHSGAAPAVEGDAAPPAIANPSLCREKIKEQLKSRLYTLKQKIYVYHWFNNRPGEFHADVDSPNFQKRIHELSVSKANRFNTVDGSETVGQGMYFAADPLSSANYGSDGTENPDNMKEALLVRLELKPGFRVVRLLWSDVKQGEGYPLSTGQACAPEKIVAFGVVNATLPLLREAMKELHINAIAYPFLYENYNAPRELKESYEEDAKFMVAFNVVDPEYVKGAAVRGIRLAELEEPAPRRPSMEQQYAKYYGLYQAKQKPQVPRAFRKWAEKRLLPSKSFDQLFQPISKQ